MQLIQTITLDTTTATISFTSIPQDATDLVILASLRDSTSSGFGNDVNIRLNGNSTGYTFRTLWGNGTTFGRAGAGSSSFYATFSSQPNSATSNTFSNIYAYIPNYAGSQNKTALIDAVAENNASGAYLTINANHWANTSAITSIAIGVDGQNLLSGSTASLYKITKA